MTSPARPNAPGLALPSVLTPVRAEVTVMITTPGRESASETEMPSELRALLGAAQPRRNYQYRSTRHAQLCGKRHGAGARLTSILTAA